MAKPAPQPTHKVGVVLGSQECTPLEFWVGVETTQVVQLDDLVVVEATLADGRAVVWYGLVDQVTKRYEGRAFDSDAFRAAEGTLPVEVSYAAHVQVTRIDPEVFVPPHPGTAVQVVHGEDYQRALCFDRMEQRVPIGLTRTEEPVFANLEFLDGTRGAHVSISGVSGVATKTSYATFLLYSLFHSGVLGGDAVNTKALIFNVKGEDLLWLDRPNIKLSSEEARRYERLALPVGPFRSVGLYAPAKRGSVLVPDTGSRQLGVKPYAWTLRELGRGRLLRFLFADAEDARAQLGFVVERVERALERIAADDDRADRGGVTLSLGGTRVTTFDQLVDLLDTTLLDELVQGAVASGTLDAFRRRLHAANQRVGALVRGDAAAANHTVQWGAHQVTVVDINRLHPTAQMFVVGCLLKRMLEEKEAKGTAKPLVLVVLDELNKYAPRSGWSPLRDVLLDIAERGRSLGVSLLGAQQTASEVERRVVANAALRVVGRLDAAEAAKGEYGFLSGTTRVRATLLQPGRLIVAQPEIPVPILLRFPFPAWATRASEAKPDGERRDPFDQQRD